MAQKNDQTNPDREPAPGAIPTEAPSRAQLETERAARQEAERVNRMLEQFIAAMAHELRTPLTAIQGWAQILRGPRRSTEDLNEGLEIIERNARAQAQMVEDLLDFSRIASGKLQLEERPVELLPVVEAAIASVQVPASAKDIQIQTRLEPLTGATITGDAQRLRQVFWNLLTNAVKFTPRGGRIGVTLRRGDSRVEMSVSDSGEGIPGDFLPHLFDRFPETGASPARRHRGLGLGLALVRGLIELHGGTVSANSAGAGRGAIFTVTLPVRADRTPTAEIGSSGEGECFRLAGLRALVVDDAPDTRELVRLVLSECDMRVTTAGSSAEAMTLLRREMFDVLISDIGMPEEDGFHLVRTLREHESKNNLPKTPAVALTAYTSAEDRRRIMLSGFQMHIAKPVEAPELIAVIASLTGKV